MEETKKEELTHYQKYKDTIKRCTSRNYYKDENRNKRREAHESVIIKRYLERMEKEEKEKLI